MSKKKTTRTLPRARRSMIGVGFVPLNDCAPLVMAAELGLFAKYGLNVELRREIGWATIRDKVVFGELDAAHAVVGMPFAATLGFGSIRCHCVSAIVLNLHGNAITLSHELWQRGVRDAQSLRQEVEKSRGVKTYTFGVTFPFASHNFLLRQWLVSGGIKPDQDVRIVVVPPPQMPANLKAGNLDGYCAGEPWNTVAVQAQIGWCPVTSAELAPLHPEKVLMARRAFAEKHFEEHTALVAALLDACAFCDEPENRPQVAATLARPEYLNAPLAALQPSFLGRFDFGHGRCERVADFHLFHDESANEPSVDKAAWVLNQMLACGQITRADMETSVVREIFRSDIFQQAAQLAGLSSSHENDQQTDIHSLTA